MHRPASRGCERVAGVQVFLEAGAGASGRESASEHRCVVGRWARDDLKPDALQTHLSLFLTTRKANLDYSVYR